MIKFAQEDWDHWKRYLLASEKWKDLILESAEGCVHKVEQWCRHKQGNPKEVAIHRFVGASFNASNQSYGIALSIEKLKMQDLQRVLVHEITHTLVNPLLHPLSIPPLMKTTLGEGIACKATVDLLGISYAQSIGFSEMEYARYEENATWLASCLWQWLKGDLFAIRKGRHEVIEPKQLPHPFLISKGGEFPKYGYFLGLHFVSEQMATGKKAISSWLKTVSVEAFEIFLNRLMKK